MELDRDTLIEKHGDRIDALAKTIRKVMASDVSLDELVNEGVIGFMEAASRYRPDGGAALWTFAQHRVRGAMIDALPELRCLPRQLVRAELDLLESHDSVTEGPQDLASQYRVFREMTALAVVSAQAEQSPAAGIERKETQAAVRRAVESLPDDQRTIIEQHAFNGVPLKDVARGLKLEYTWVTRLYHRALGNLREILGDAESISAPESNGMAARPAGAEARRRPKSTRGSRKDPVPLRGDPNR